MGKTNLSRSTGTLSRAILTLFLFASLGSFPSSFLETDSKPAEVAGPSCEELGRILKWSGSRHGGVRRDDLGSSEFSQRALTLFVEKLDPQRLFFTQQDADSFRDAGAKAWKAFLEKNQCAYFETWVDTHYPKAKQAFTWRFSRLTKDEIHSAFPKRLRKKPLGEEADSVKFPQFKTFASDEAELKKRLVEWVGKIGSLASAPLLAAYGNDRRKLIEDSLEEMFFETRLAPRQVLAKAALSAMDPYSTYFSASEFEEFYHDLAGSTSGIGIKVRKAPEGLFIERVVKESPAATSKRMQAGDVIVAIDGTPLAPLSFTGAKSRLKGVEGSVVRLTLRRGKEAPTVVKIARRRFSFDEARISYRLVPAASGQSRVALVSIPSFYGRGGMDPLEEERSASEDLQAVLTKLLALKPTPSAVILDLRGNPGGFLEEAVSMAGFFIGNKPVVAVVEKDSKRVLNDRHGRVLYSGPLLVWMDEESASASEVLAGALKDNQRAVVLGAKRSYGKGSVQKLFHLEDEILRIGFGSSEKGGNHGVVKLTTSLFYSPLGHSPSNGGVATHIELKSSDSEKKETAPHLGVAAPEQSPFLEPSELSEIRNQEKIRNSEISALKELHGKRVLERQELPESKAESGLPKPPVSANLDSWEADGDEAEKASELSQAVAIAEDFARLEKLKQSRRAQLDTQGSLSSTASGGL